MPVEIDEKLLNIVELCAEFREAVSAHLQGNEELTAKAMETITDEEMLDLQEMAMELAAGSMSAAFGNVSKKFADLTIYSAESTVDLCGRVMDPAELKPFIPEGLKNEESIQSLEENNAPKFAALCRQTL